jgi:hypothetical protein
MRMGLNSIEHHLAKSYRSIPKQLGVELWSESEVHISDSHLMAQVQSPCINSSTRSAVLGCHVIGNLVTDSFAIADCHDRS